MRIQLLSDLHMERHPNFKPQAIPGVDVLVLAGDIGSYQAGSRLAGDDFGLGVFSPLQPDAPWPNVLFVPGNHEYDSLEFDEAQARMRETCARLGITWLDQQVVTIKGVRFMGTTLWSDFDAFAGGEPTPTRQMQKREKAYRAANFYLKKNTTLQNGEPMLAEAMRTLALQCQDWLRQALAEPFDGHTVVVTHFAPSLRSADPRYGLTPGTAGFCNELDSLIAQASLWLHGHLHCPNDYLVHGCRVVANPLGYAIKGEQAAHRSDLVIELPAL
jgi:predicted phosphodiesterase